MSKTTTPDSESLILSQWYTSLMFGSNNLNNLFEELSNHYKSIITTFPSSFPTWTSTDDFFYYNLVKNKDKELVKRKVTFGQTLTI